MALLAALQRGEIAGRAIASPDRRACVEHLVGEGVAVPQIAQLLGVADRTVFRDLQAVRRGHALKPEVDLTAELGGRLAQEFNASIANARRIARDAKAPHRDRLAAGRDCLEMTDAFIGRLQTMGFLRDTRRERDVSPRVGEDLDELPGMLAEVGRLELSEPPEPPDWTGPPTALGELRRLIRTCLPREANPTSPPPEAQEPPETV